MSHAGKRTEGLVADFPSCGPFLTVVIAIVEGMATKIRSDYQFSGGLEKALLDMIQVGIAGHASGVRQLANRLIRSIPPEVEDSDVFKAAIHAALANAYDAKSLRFSRGELPQDGETQPLVDVEPTPVGNSLVLDDVVFHELREIVEERRRGDDLARAGVTPTRSLLLSGAPGVGKTLAARWLAEQMGVPLVSLDLASVVSSYLGSSGRNIKSVLKYAQSGPCVLLLDEFDAVAKRRDDDTDIGELKRIVNVLLVELDRWSETSLLVAATNHLHLLDPAIERRFDRHLELMLPGPTERLKMLERLSGSEVDRKVLELCAEALVEVSGSELVRLWQKSHRRAVLTATSIEDELTSQIICRRIDSVVARDRLWLAASNRLGLSARQIALKANVSHPTVSAALKRAKESDAQ